ncbi:hypothetical protein AQB9606_04488 [Aquabacterium sp. CECT 9606]|nr:hypothetical protein AQB9606_04488 [Aquabacterium sp. CECT 9606]
MVQQHLEQGAVVQAALGLQGLHELLERQVLVRLRAQRGVFGLRQHLAERHAGMQKVAQHLGVDEKAHHALCLDAVSVGDGHAHADVILSGVALQQRLPASQQGHEQGGALLVRSALQIVHQGDRQGLLVMGSPVDGLGLTRVVRGQLQHGVLTVLQAAFKLVLPVTELTILLAIGQPLALPSGVVRILDGQGRQAGFLARQVGAVKRHELVNDDLHGPAVRDDVVHRHGQQVRARVHADHGHTQQRAVAQVKWGLVDLPGLRLRQAGSFSLVGLRHVDQRDVQCHHGLDPLLGQAVGTGAEHRAQRLMPIDQRLERTPQGIEVQFALQLQAARDMVGRAGRVQLPQEPLPRLRGRQRHRSLPALCIQARDERLGTARSLGRWLAHGQRQTAQRLAFKQLLGQQVDAALARPGNHLQAQDRVAPQFEEVVVSAHLVTAQDFCPDGGQCFFHLALRGFMSVPGHGLRLGQGLAVKLAIGIQRQLGQHHDHTGHHVVGQDRCQTGLQCHHVQRLRGLVGLRHHIGSQRATAIVLLHQHHGGFMHAGLRPQGRGHFTQLNAVAAHLDLVVDPAQEGQAALLAKLAHPVARAVKARASLPWMGHEALGGGTSPLLVTPRQG